MIKNFFHFNIIPGHSGNLGEIVMGRPRALNAHNQAMCITLATQLHEWAQDNSIKAVIIRSADERAFCAGGDIRELYDIGRHGQWSRACDFFYDEYRLVKQIYHYPKPYIALIDGIAMGGGLGISVHGSHCLVTERALLAMPEAAIGFFPDVAGSYFFNRSPGKLGVYLALTGARIKAADAIYTGLAKTMLSSSHIPALIEALAATQFPGDARVGVDQILQEFSITPDPAPLTSLQTKIDQYFAGNNLESILNILEQDQSDWAKNTLHLLHSRSPTSLKVILQQLRVTNEADITACLRLDYILAQSFLQSHDFYEGVRAVVVDKNQDARWSPASLAEVTDDMVNSYFDTTNKSILNFDIA